MIPKKLANYLYWQAEKYRKRIGIKERLAWLEHNQQLSPQEMQLIQAEKLNVLLHHAFNTVPFYKNLFQEHALHPDDFKSEADLKKIPLLTREILLKNQDQLVSTQADFATLKNNYSSGSTGKRAVFKQDANFRLWMRAHQLRTYKWCRWDIGERFVLLWGSEIYWNMHSITDKLVNILSNRREFNTFKLSNELIANFTKVLKRFDPILISSYSNALHLISLQAKKFNLKLPALKAIQTTSEPMPPAMRERVEKIFQCEIFDKYGCRETNIVSHESPAHDGMLIQSENVVVEFINKENQACRIGESGKVILTALNNFSMPLIRYETSDIASPIAGYSTNGFPFPRMSAVSGREQDLIYTPNGDYIDSYFFSYLLMSFDSVHWFQVIQDDYEKLRIRVFAPDNFAEAQKNTIIERIHHHTGFQFNIEFELLNSMPDSPTGKFRLCVSHVKEAKQVTEAIVG